MNSNYDFTVNFSIVNQQYDKINRKQVFKIFDHSQNNALDFV